MSVTRDLWIVLRARDEASRIINSFARNLGGVAGGAAGALTPFEQALRNISLRLDQFGRASTLAGAAMAGLGFAGAAMIKSAISVAAEYDRQARLTLTQVDQVGISLENVADIGRRVARQVGMPFESMQKTLYMIFSSIDVNAAQAEEMLRKFAQEAVAGSTDVEKAARLSISIMNALGYSIENLGHLQDVQFQIVRKGVITYDELAETLGRALPATARAGQSIETVGAMIAFLTRGGLSAAMAASSAARAMEAFAHPKIVARLEGMGIKVRDLHGNFLPLLEVMGQMNAKIGQMAAPERAKFLQELFTGAGGTIQARRFWDLAFKNFDDFSAMVGQMQNSTGVFQNAYETMAGSVAVQTELLRNKWMLIKEALGRALLPQVLKFIKVLGGLLDWFDRLPQSTKSAIAQFLLWGTVISFLAGALLILVGMLAMMASWIITGGAALAGMLAVMLGLIGGVAAFTLAINAAYKSSENFRAIIATLQEYIRDIRDVLVGTATRIKKSFEDEVLPALREFWQYVDKNILPLIREFGDAWREKVLPKIKEAANFIEKLVKSTFKLLADIIQNYLIPSIQYLVDWWNTHKKTLEPMMPILAQIVKLMVIIGAVILALPLFVFVAFVATLTTVLMVIGTLIFTLTKLWSWIKIAGTVIGEFFVGLWNGIESIGKSIGGFFVGLWKDIVDIVKGGGRTVSGVLNTALAFLYNTIWVPFWNMFGGFIKEAWGLIVDLINFWTTLINEIIKDWIIPLVQDVITGWNMIVDGIRSAWNMIVFLITLGISTVVGWIVTGWNTVFNWTRTTWNNIQAIISYVMNVVKDKVIKPIMDAIMYLWKTYFKDIYDTVATQFSKAYENIKGWIQYIKDLFGGAKGMLLQAGKDIIQGLIDGVTEKIHDLRERLKKLTDDIPKWKGPQAFDLRLLTPTGRNIMMGLSKGIADQVPLLKRQLQDISSEIGYGLPTPNLASPSSAAAPRTPTQNTTYQYITVNTQEIDPKANAAELGWLLQARG